MTRLTPQVEKAVDTICSLGCELVGACICALQSGETRPEYAALDAGQRDSLLGELQEIMSVYDEARSV